MLVISSIYYRRVRLTVFLWFEYESIYKLNFIHSAQAVEEGDIRGTEHKDQLLLAEGVLM